MSYTAKPDLTAPSAAPKTGWSSLGELTGRHWFIFTVAALAWILDCMDQQLFNLARKSAVTDLLGVPPNDPRITVWSGYATSIFLIGWASGGIIFGILGDRIGRVKTLIWCVLLYSIFTGLSALSMSVWDFACYRFLTGLGIGGVFAGSAVLLAETMPPRARPFALGLFQASSALGNCTAAGLYMLLGHYQEQGAFASWGMITPWRLMFVVGTIPALLVVLIQSWLREPERWLQARDAARSGQGQKLGSYVELFGSARWRRHALFGFLLTFVGVVALWGIGFFSYDLVQNVFRKTFQHEGYLGAALEGQLKLWAGITSLVFNVGGALGIFAFSWLTHWTGRRPAFAISFVTAAISTAATFWFLDTRADVFWMIPLMGFCQLALFGGYAIYLPELFPTRLRSSGTSFCYNVGRMAAAVGPSALGLLTQDVFQGCAEPMRYAGVTVCAVFLLGLLVLPFLPETKGKPLPE